MAANVTTCPECHRPLKIDHQAGLVVGRGITLVTCEHKPCILYGVTLDTRDLPLTPGQIDGYQRTAEDRKRRGR